MGKVKDELEATVKGSLSDAETDALKSLLKAFPLSR
jgi:hypothetical protein